MTTPSVSNPPVTTDARRQPPAYPPRRDATANPSHHGAASSAAEPPPGAGPIAPDRKHASHDAPDDAATSAFATGTRAVRPDTPAVDTLVPERHRFRESMAPFVHQMAQFCSNDAIRLAGNWNARLVLDERILPATTLNLSLSRFDLSLDFEIRDPATRQFLAAHLDELERMLRVALHTPEQSNDVFLSIR